MGQKAKKRQSRKDSSFLECLEKIKMGVARMDDKKGAIILYPKHKHHLYVKAMKFLISSDFLKGKSFDFKKLDDAGMILGVHITPGN